MSNEILVIFGLRSVPIDALSAQPSLHPALYVRHSLLKGLIDHAFICHQ